MTQKMAFGTLNPIITLLICSTQERPYYVAAVAWRICHSGRFLKKNIEGETLYYAFCTISCCRIMQDHSLTCCFVYSFRFSPEVQHRVTYSNMRAPMTNARMCQLPASCLACENNNMSILSTVHYFQVLFPLLMLCPHSIRSVSENYLNVTISNQRVGNGR